MTDGNGILQAIPEDTAPEKVAASQKPDQFVTSNGIVFKLKAVPPLLIMDAQRAIVAPVPPKVRNYEKGDGEEAPIEENPNDPAYIRAMLEHQQKTAEVTNAIFLTRGCIVEHVPPDIDPMDGTEWAEEVQEFAGIKVPAVGRRRFYCWLKYVALTSLEDFQGLLNKLTTLGGVTLETDVQLAEESFRPASGGDASEGVSTSEEV